MTEILRSGRSAVGRPGRPSQEPDPRRWKALIVLCITNFMVILDSQIVILALPSIEKDLRLSAGNGQWVLSAYLLAFGGLLLFGGRLADLLGRRRMFLAGTLLFLVSSLMCGLAWSGGVLIGARVVQGISAAISMPAALSILMTTFSVDAERNKALAYWSGFGGFGATAALLIGGALTGSLGWQWIFFLNVPVAAGLLAFSPVLLRESRDPNQTRAYDPAGALMITAGLLLLIGAIVEAPTAGWASWGMLGMLLGAVVFIGLFVVVESRQAMPLVPLRIFRSRMFIGGNLTIALITMTTWGLGVTVSEYAQDVLKYSPLRFGLGMTALTVTAVIGAYAAQAAVARVGIRTVALASMVLMGLGAILLMRAPAGGTYWGDLLPGLLLFGPGLGGGPVAAIGAALSSVNPRDVGVASGVNTAAFQIGAALGTAIASSVIIAYGGQSSVSAVLVRGFHAGFLACLILAAVGMCVALVLLKRPGSRARNRRTQTETPAS